MLLDLTRFRQPEAHVARTFQPAEVGGDPDAYEVVAPVELAFDIHKDEDKFRLVGTVRASLTLACSRCLEPFGLPVDAAFDLRYLPASLEAAGDDQEIEDDDVDTSYYRDDQIDLAALVREQLYLSLPMKPLCQEACRGLCAQCGTNLNTASCHCAPVWDDPRLAPLKALKGHDA